MSTGTPFLGHLVLVTDNEIVRVLCHFEYYTQRAEYNLQARRFFLGRLKNEPLTRSFKVPNPTVQFYHNGHESFAFSASFLTGDKTDLV